MPLWSGPISKEAGLLGDKKTAQDTLNGTYIPREDNDNHTKVMLNLLHTPEPILDSGPISIMVSRKEFKSNYKRER